MAEYIKKIRTVQGDKQIDFNSLANLPQWITDTTGVTETASDGSKELITSGAVYGEVAALKQLINTSSSGDTGADGLSFDSSTGTLALTKGGSVISGSSVKISAEAEGIDAIGSYTWDASTRTLSFFDLDGASAGDPIVIPVGEGVDLSGYYTKSEVDEKISSVEAGDVDLSGYYTKSEVDEKISAVEAGDADLSNYYTKAEVDEAIGNVGGEADLSGYYTKTEVDDKLKDVVAGDVDLGDYYTKAEVDTKFVESQPNLEGYYTKEEVDAKVAGVESGDVDLSGYYTKSEVDEKIAGIDVGETDLSGYYTKGEVDTKLLAMPDEDDLAAIKKAAIGSLDWDDDSRLMTVKNVNGEVMGDAFVISGGGSGGGGASTYSMRIVNEMSSSTFSVASSTKALVSARFYEYFGGNSTGVQGTLKVEYKLESAEQWNVGLTQNVAQGNPFTVDVTNMLSLNQVSNVKFTVTGGESGESRSLTFNITQVEARIEAVNFDGSATYSMDFNFQYRCVGRGLNKTVKFKLDDDIYQSVDVGTSHNTILHQSLPLLTDGIEYGAHDLVVWFETDDGAKSNELRYSIIWVPTGSEETAPILSIVCQQDEVTYGDTLDVEYTVYTPGQETTDELIFTVYTLEGEERTNLYTQSLANITNNETKTWSCTTLPSSGLVYVEAKSGDVVKTISVMVNELTSDYDLELIGTNLVYAYDAAGRTNNDADKALYECQYTTAAGVTTKIQAELTGCNWVSNGYVDGTSLTLSGSAKQTIKLPMFSTSYTDGEGQTVNLESVSGATVTTNGRTFEIDYKVSNVTDINAEIIRCMSSEHAGFVVTPQTCYLLSSNGTNVQLDSTGFIENEDIIAAAYVKDDVRIRLSFVIEPKGTVQYTDTDGTKMSGQCVNIFINGQFANSFVYPDNATFTSSEYITIGSDTCITNVYSVRVYNRGLSASEILHNYMASPLSVQDRIDRFTDNDVLDDDGEVDYNKAKLKYNCLLITGSLSPYKGADGIRMSGKMESGLILTKPDGNGGFTTEFSLMDKDSYGNWVSSNNVQGTSSTKFPVKNYKVYLAKNETDDLGVTTVKKVKYSLKGKDSEGNDISIGESTLCWKGDYMSSDHANTFNANLADTLYQDEIFDNSKSQNTVYGIRCLLFQRDDDGDSTPIRLVGDGALNNDKGNTKTFGLESDGDTGATTKKQKWEFLNNTEALCSFQSDKLQELVDGTLRATIGLESNYPDQGDLKDEGLTPNYDYIQSLFTWVCQRANFWEASSAKLPSPLTYNGQSYNTMRDYRKAIFLNEFDKHFNRHHVLVYYLFTEFVALCDNRAKNMFFQTMDVTTENLLNTSGEAMNINDAIATDGTGVVDSDMIDWENSTFAIWMPVLYDLDSCFGVENSGYLQIPYYAEWDYHLGSSQKFNGYESVLWLMVEEALADDIKELAQSMTNRASGVGGLNYDVLYEYHIKNNAELICPAVVNRDMEVKYDNPWTEGFVNYSLEGAPLVHMNDYKYLQRGSRTQQKDAFIFRRCNMLYSKYQCSKFINNNINFRCGVTGGLAATNSDITVVANQALYPAVKYGDGSAAVVGAPKTMGGTAVTIIKPGETAADKVGYSDTVYIAGGTLLTDIGDISKFKPYELQLQNATGLKRLVIGSDAEGFENNMLSGINTASCKILEEINIMNCTKLGTLDLSNNGLIKKVYATGSSINSVLLPDGGVLEVLHLGPVANIEVLNHTGLTDFECTGYDNLRSLRVENTPTIPVLDIVEERLDYLTGGLRLAGIDADLEDTSLLERLISNTAKGKYIDNNGILSEDANAYPYISGTIRVPSIGSYLLAQLNEAYPYLTIEANTIIEQYLVRFKNDDGTVLDTQYIIRGQFATDPVTRADKPIETPTKESTIAHIYEYKGWDADPTTTLITANTDFCATYNVITREYTVRWFNGSAKLEEQKVLYGESAEFSGSTPTDVSMESYLTYRLFNGWDKSTGYITGDIDVYAKFTEAQAPDDKTLAEMNPTELYALIKTGVLNASGANNTLISSGDEFELLLGHDMDFYNVESHELISLSEPRVFDGTDATIYVPTIDGEKIKLFENQDAFTMVIDFAMGTESGILVACQQGNASGLTLKNTSNSTGQVNYRGSSIATVSSGTEREVVVIRRKPDDLNLYVYASNKVADEIVESMLSTLTVSTHSAPLTFGGQVMADGYANDYGTGTVYWAKIWMDDLGEANCRKLASYPRVSITMQAAGNKEHVFRMFYLADEERYANCCFLSKGVLDVKKSMSSTGTNVGGWSKSDMRTWLNTKILGALPDQWQYILAKVNVRANEGNSKGTSAEIITSQDYMWIPALGEIMGSDEAPYVSEFENRFNLFTQSSDRIKRDSTGTPQFYWLRSALATSSTTFQCITSNGYSGGYMGEYCICFGFCI